MPHCGTLSATWGYDAGSYGKGRLTSQGNSAVSSTTTYDARGRVTLQCATPVIHNQQRCQVSAYDSADRLTTSTYPTGESVTTSYDAGWRPLSLTSPQLGTLISSATCV